MTYKVGVNVVEGQAASPISGVSTAVASIIGTFHKGPLNKATLVTSMAQFEATFGDRPAAGSTSYYSVKAFFAKAGTGQLYIVRVASGTAAKALVNLDDAAAADTLRISALSEGAWGNSLAVKPIAHNILTTTLQTSIIAGATSAVLTSVGGLEVGSDIEFDNGTNQEQVRLTAVDAANRTVTWVGGLINPYTTANATVTSLEFGLEVYLNGVREELLTGYSMNPDVSFFVQKALVSSYISTLDVKATKDDTYEDLPAPLSVPVPLTSGADGLSDVLASHYQGSQAAKTGVYALDEVDNLFRFACPDPLLTDAVEETALIALTQSMLDYADARANIQYYGDIPDDKTPSQAVTFAENFEGRRLAMFWPWVKVLENGSDIYLPPSAFVLGAAVDKDYRKGIHYSVGGEKLAYAIDLKYHVSRDEGETLNDAGVNTIRKFIGAGIKLFGGRTRSAVSAWRFLDQSEYWNYVAQTIERNLQDVVFQPNTPSLWATIRRRVTAFLADEQAKGALFDVTNQTGAAYAVVIDATNNSASEIASGLLHLDIEYTKASAAEKAIVKLTSSPFGRQLTISEAA